MKRLALDIVSYGLCETGYIESRAWLFIVIHCALVRRNFGWRFPIPIGLQNEKGIPDSLYIPKKCQIYNPTCGLEARKLVYRHISHHAKIEEEELTSTAFGLLEAR